MQPQLPGFNNHRLISLMRTAIERCRLSLEGACVLTEAASGAYLVTPLIAALAGADEVHAVTRSTRYGSFEEIRDQTLQVAALAGVADRIRIHPEKTEAIVSGADMITNSGHLRPLDAATIGWMKPTAVIPLMYEGWEFRDQDLDLAACLRRGIPVAGTNERNPRVGVFPFLGIMAVKMMLDAGLEVHGNRVLLLCDNPFGPYIEEGLRGAGAEVRRMEGFEPSAVDEKTDAVLVALRPQGRPLLGTPEAEALARNAPGAVILQYFGELDRAAFGGAGLAVWPLREPAPGHMGILPSEVGPEPIVRLQTGGIKVGELLWRARREGLNAREALDRVIESGYGDAIPTGKESHGACD